MIPDNQLARGIQSKILYDLGMDPLVADVRREAPCEPGGLGGRSPSNAKYFLNQNRSKKKVCSDFDDLFFAYVSDDYSNFFFIFLKSS